MVELRLLAAHFYEELLFLHAGIMAFSAFGMPDFETNVAVCIHINPQSRSRKMLQFSFIMPLNGFKMPTFYS